MRGIMFNILFVVCWAVIGHFSATAWLFGSCIMFPAVFIVTGRTFKYAPLVFWQVVPICLFLVLASDFLFRAYGQGECDQLGSTLVGLSYIVTLVCSAIALIPVSINMYYQQTGLNRIPGKKEAKIVICVVALFLFVLGCSMIIEPEIELWMLRWAGLTNA